MSSKFNFDGKKQQGYKINPQTQRIDLKEVSEADNSNLQNRMLKLADDFQKIDPQNFEMKKTSIKPFIQG